MFAGRKKITYNNAIEVSAEYKELYNYCNDKVNEVFTNFASKGKLELGGWLLKYLIEAKRFTDNDVAITLLAAHDVNAIYERQLSWLGLIPFPNMTSEAPAEMKKNIADLLHFHLKSLRKYDLTDLPKEIPGTQGSKLGTLIANLYAKTRQVQLA
ncbi:MAG: hypothetical protein ACYCQI_08300 [Gammaproteobacteria bacterium]